MKTYRNLEKPTKIFGLPLLETVVVVFLPMILIFLTAIVRMVIPISQWINLVILVLDGIVWYLLVKANKKNHPSFILSNISYFFKQPKRIVDTQNYKIKHVRRNNQEFI